MTTKVQKWGNSYAVRLPKAMVDSLDMKNNSQVEIVAHKGVISIRPKVHKVELKDLLQRVTKETMHSGVDWGKEKGNEIW